MAHSVVTVSIYGRIFEDNIFSLFS